jgi:hypothetical protein
MAKVTRVKYNSKKFNKLFGEDRPIMEPPKVKYSFEKRREFHRLERLYCDNLKYSFNV